MKATSYFHADDDQWTGFGSVLLRMFIVFYCLLLLIFIWISKDIILASFNSAPILAIYSVAVVLYLLSRFVISLFYRPLPDIGYRPSLTIIIPAFNEEDSILHTIESAIAAEYDDELKEILVINDGSTDDTWNQMLLAKEQWPFIILIDLVDNYGKRAAMAEGIRRATGDFLVFVDSDSFLAKDALIHMVQPFTDPRVGAVVGHADVANVYTNWLTKMQQVRYYAAFRIIKGTEDVLSGTVTCASGCGSAYRKSVIEKDLELWEFQEFLGKPATFGDDRALTNKVLQTHRVKYQSTAKVATNVPDSFKRFLKQQLRWKKSWTRESAHVVKYFWRKNPISAVLTYASIIFPLTAPIIIVLLMGRRIFGDINNGGIWFYIIGSYAMAILYALYYAFQKKSSLWYYGLVFAFIYMFILSFMTYYALFTLKDNRWGTRNSTVNHVPVDQDKVLVLAVPEIEPPPLQEIVVENSKKQKIKILLTTLLATDPIIKRWR